MKKIVISFFVSALLSTAGCSSTEEEKALAQTEAKKIISAGEWVVVNITNKKDTGTCGLIIKAHQMKNRYLFGIQKNWTGGCRTISIGDTVVFNYFENRDTLTGYPATSFLYVTRVRK
jgi:hypothetical protein